MVTYNSIGFVILCGALVVFQAGCPDDFPTTSASEATTTTTSTTTSSSTGFLPTTTESESGSTGGGPVCEQNYPLPVDVFELVVENPLPAPEPIFASRFCDQFNFVGDGEDQLSPTGEDNFSVYVYHPKVPMSLDDWPAFKLPYVVFSPGAGQNAADEMTNVSFYRNIVEAYTSLGFVVFVIQTPAISDWSSRKRGNAMACTALWAFSTDEAHQWSESGNDRLNCDFVVSGHSRGGEGAYYFAQEFVGPAILAGFEGRILRGVVALAPRSKSDATSSVDGASTIPYLILHGANDEDISNQPTRAFEIYGDEEAVGLPKHDKFLLWAHNIAHKSWGGTSAGATVKAEAIESLYIPAFLRWQILEGVDPTDRQLFTDLVHYDRSVIGFDSSIEDVGFWDQCLPEFVDLGGTPLNGAPVIFGDFAPGLKGDPDARLQIDTMKRMSVSACASPVTPSSSSESVTVVGLTSGLSTSQVCMGSSQNLIAPIALNDFEHSSASVMRVRWGGLESGGTIEWSVEPEDLTDYSFLSFRAGDVHSLSEVEEMVTFSVGVVTVDGMATPLFPVDVKSYTQDNQPPVLMTTYVTDFMRTIRIPLSDFCDQGADISQVVSVVFAFPEVEDRHVILIDSLEFTKSSDAMDIGQCL